MGIEFKETTLSSSKENNEYKNQKLIHICEVCGIKDVLTPEEGFEAGWDYAPRMYPFKIISPRTCNKCGMEHTAWWQICVNKKTFDELSSRHKETVKRIYNEPDSIIVKREYVHFFKDSILLNEIPTAHRHSELIASCWYFIIYGSMSVQFLKVA